jgi:acyl-CoA synthetase (NDP forming)
MLSDPAVTQRLEQAGVAVFADPTRAVRAVAGAARMASLRQRMQPVLAGNPLASTPLPADRPLTEHEAKALLSGAGIPVLPEKLCRDGAEAAGAARGMGFPVVVKIVSPDIAHKTEIGGVIVNLQDADAVAVALPARYRITYRTLANDLSTLG